ncbi:globin [Colletotrichum graminicola]|uniref:nitric oxide dioxygenase n=1 Tax=Colletotrichum graminicola (strain M1.001 / M2 / FGSC 10212) TaxID=645133 RepID=E3QQD2_COLGM|nr:globin [Colletotrichum graminicola M1.001]EFQ33070.1 globin [Colletotrichum graminicola M1.001]WDK21998.1 globin [Colletotrichum graminicola]
MGLTQDQINIVKSTAPVLKVHGETITTLFYKDMIDTHPELKNVFSLRNQASGEQPRALAQSVLAYATYIDDLPKLKAAVERIAHKHASLYIRPEQYDIVGTHLMKAIGEVLGDALTPEIAEAWTAAYAQLAQVFVGRESEMYREAGPWTDWRKFRIIRRVNESDSVTSFYLAPSDGKLPLPKYLPGQYISVRVPVPQLGGITQPRQYSLSDAASRGDCYRISVKREATVVNAPQDDISKGLVPGLVSNLLHDSYQAGDEVEVSHPQGDFFLDTAQADKADVPLVLLSAGVGATPLMSILNTVLGPESKTPSRPVKWVHAARNSGSLVFAKHIRNLTRERENVSAHIFLNEVKPGDQKGQEYDFEQHLDLTRLPQEDLGLADNRTEYYVCGPRDWMLKVRLVLESMGIERGRVKLELFATGDVEQ